MKGEEAIRKSVGNGPIPFLVLGTELFNYR
jgi:hypothetical protein